VDGDRMIAVMSGYIGGRTITPPAGWTLVDPPPLPPGTFIGIGFQVFEKVAGPSEPADYTFTLDSATRISGTIWTLVGSDNEILTLDAEQQNGGSTTPIVTEDDRLSICVYAWVYALQSGEFAFPTSDSRPGGFLTAPPVNFSSLGRRKHWFYVDFANSETMSHTTNDTSNPPNAASLVIQIVET
jgi:hypothetical protein